MVRFANKYNTMVAMAHDIIIALVPLQICCLRELRLVSMACLMEVKNESFHVIGWVFY